MVNRTIRINKYLYDKLRVISKHYHISINSLIIELIEIGYLVKEKEEYEKDESV